MKLPPSVGTKKVKAIEQLLEELNIEHRPIATEAICEQFNELRSDIVLLYELQQALTNCDYEFQTLRHRYESIAPGKVWFILFDCIKVISFILFIFQKNIDFGVLESSLSASSSSLFSSLSTANTPQKRISEIFDVSLTPTGPLVNNLNFFKLLNARNKINKLF